MPGSIVGKKGDENTLTGRGQIEIAPGLREH